MKGISGGGAKGRVGTDEGCVKSNERARVCVEDGEEKKKKKRKSKRRENNRRGTTARE